MKRILYFLAAWMVLLIGCTNSSTTKIDKEQRRNEDFPIVGFVEKFVAAHPSFDINNIKREQADRDFFESFTETSDSINLIQNIPVKLCVMNKDSKGNIWAQFRAWIKPQNFNFPSPIIDDVYFDVIGIIDSKYVDILNEDTYYTINGKFIKRIKSLDSFFALLECSSTIYTPSFSVRKDEIWDDKYEVSLGMMLFGIDSISVFHPQQYPYCYQ